MADLSLRHIPDLSDASAIADLSDTSFQIPPAAHDADDLLLADNTLDFFNNASDTLSTPAPPSRPRPQSPLTLAELTPRSKPPPRAAPVRSSLRPHPGVATPHRATVATELSTALSEDLSPFRKQDPSFELPVSHTPRDDLLADDSGGFLGEEADDSTDPGSPQVHSPITLSHLSSGLSTARSPSVAPAGSPLRTVDADPASASDYGAVADVPQVNGDSGTACLVSDAEVPIMPNMSEFVSRGTDNDTTVISKKGKAKALPKTNLLERQKKLPGGDSAKRKRISSTTGALRSAKPKSLTVALAHTLSNPSKKPPVPAQRRPLQGTSTRGPPKGSDRATANKAGPSKQPTDGADAKPLRWGGGLADTLMSYGQKLMATTSGTEQSGEAALEPTPTTPVVTDTIHTSGNGLDRLLSSADDQTDSRRDECAIDPGYLTLSQLSPRKCASGAQDISSAEDTRVPASVVDHRAEGELSPPERSPSPMRRSSKRAMSPAADAPAHERKRSKTISGGSAPSSSKEVKEIRTRKPALQPSRSKNALAGGTRPGPHSRRVVSAATAASDAGRVMKHDGIRKPDSSSLRSTLRARSGSGDSSAAAKVTDTAIRRSTRSGAVTSHGISRSGHFTRSERENTPVDQDRQMDGEASGRSTSTSNDRPSANSLPAKPTKPSGFNFATSTRMEARSQQADLQKSAGSSTSLKRSRTHVNVHPIPDFKALHALQESVLAQKRAEIQPIVPMEFGLATETRAHEREKFEEARRARERELERQAEERRRQRELEEEAEIRELRKRAVPKANEVPEWYAYAPKKARADSGS